MPIREQLTAAVGEHRGAEAADRLCEACVEFLSIDAAAISLVFDGTNSGTLGASSPLARSYDELQFTFGEGPCLDSVAVRAPVLVTDLGDPDELRWPAYTPALLAYEMRGVFAVPVLVAGEYIGALDLFRAQPIALDQQELAGALIAAELAELPLLDLIAEEVRAALADADADAWTDLTSLSRTEVSQATGMLMAQLDVEAPEALVRLRAHAYATGRSATEVARDILARGLRLEADHDAKP